MDLASPIFPTPTERRNNRCGHGWTWLHLLLPHLLLPLSVGVEKRQVPSPFPKIPRETRRPCPSRSGHWPRSRIRRDRKSTRLNSSHGYISYAVFCLKKKKTTQNLDILDIHDQALRL